MTTATATTPETLTIAQVARRLSVTVHCVLAWVNSKHLPALNVARDPRGGKPRWRIRLADLEAFESRRLTTPPAPRRRRTRDEDYHRKYAE